MLNQALFVTLVGVAVQAAQHDGISMEPPILPQVNNLVFSGAGCSQGTANATWSPASWSDWTVSLHDLNLEATGKPGPGGLPSESDCTIHATFSNTSPGWQLALETVSIRGYAALSSGSSISAAASVSWASTAGASGTGHKTAAPAPAERNVSLTNSRTMDEASAMGALLDFSSVPVWSGCSDGAELGNLALRFRFGVHVQTNSTNGYAAFGGLVDDGHGEISARPAVVQRLQWAWRSCHVTMGSTTFFPKPKTTTQATTVSTNSTAWTTAASANTTAATTTVTTDGKAPPFGNSTTALRSHPTRTATTKSSSFSWITSTQTASSWHNTTTPLWTNGTSTGSTSRAALLPTQR
ncbi:hypothetical protein SPBR_00807 [Sporothrix brasiliensis 5110]|uniref:Secreted protein n=1 Tax=Sporothrix brasiliensis 5110 TaxID=1398154 RepID=A0A0C2IXP5_9PEZI|nr:uncharacterized protein SPBR_00807 [Sporothrix brasiliensis 5110]KIH89802.1 hypothetical protein SPBR_00807 [Sporothrix brasiliensis 5110]